jgi:hypothetical protein
MAREMALRVIPFRGPHRGLSGWRSLSAKTRVNLGLAPEVLLWQRRSPSPLGVGHTR